MQISRQDAYNLLCEWVKNENLRKHMLGVEAVMRAYARKYGEEEEMWGTCGLLHDFDYERYPTYSLLPQPQGHPFEGVKILKDLGYPKEVITAILGHATYSGVSREAKMAKVLFAIDELCGFVIACALMRPDKLATLEAPSVKKKLKDKSFAAKVNRQDIEQGIIELGIDKDEHINFVIQALKSISKDLGF